MKSKYRFRRILSGVMAAVTILSTVISPLTVYASEEPKAAEPPAYESVKDQLDENEVVKATDLELEVGQDFDVSTDFTNLEIKDESKVKVTFQKAENDAGENFSTSHADTYHAVYYVEPVNQNHPVYQIGRNLIVKEPVTAAQSEPQTEQAVTEEDTGSDDEEAASQEETETVPVETEIVEPETAESETEEPEETEPEFQGGLSESEFDAALEEAETENTTDKESGLTLSDVLEQAGEQDIDLMAMEDGETVSFTAVNTSTRATQDVDVTRGTAYYYADYGLGSYVTELPALRSPKHRIPYTLLQEITSDEKGQAHFTLDLPLGTYYVKEISAPDGFVSSDEVLEFDATYQGQDIQTIKLKSIKKNQPTTIEVTKSDLTTGVELNGASLSVLDEDGNVIDSWTSVKDEPHVIKYLTVGKTYILRESLAPHGYLKTTDVKFTIEDTAEIQKVEMQDHVPKALLIVNKKGEFLDKITLLDNVKGVVEHFFEYITGSLTDVTFEIRAAEDIKAADGVSPDYYSKDELVATVTTDANGVAEVADLPVGKYYVKEVGTAYGYILDEEPRYVDLSYRDQDTPVVVYDEDWQNNRQKVKVNVLKKEKDTDRVLKGGIFGLYTRNDILSASGKVLMEADTLIELKTTDVDGKISFIADLPIDGTYYVKELYAPDGFVTTGEEQEFVFEYQGDKEAEASYEFVFEDEPTTVELSKTDLTTGEELPGARLQLTDENGAVVEEWTSTKEPHIIKELVVGKSYTLTENKPADGYATAESITFTVENTAEIQKQVMEDDVTKVKISKTDITGDNEIEGAKLTITDENGNIVETWTSGKEPHYIEKLPIGKYTLKEEQAPNGYVVAEEITFEVADTAEIQKVAMKDDTAKGRLIIEKTDKDTGAALKDAEFELRDADGKVVETMTTDENGHATSGLLAIGTYKDGKFDKAATYYLVETKAPEGYQLDETKHEVTFTYVDDKTPVIEVIQKVTNEKLPEDTPFVSNPKTGDDTNLWIPALCLILSAGGLIGMGVASRRKKKKGGR